MVSLTALQDLIADRVGQGASLLDAVRPGWRDDLLEVDLEMQSCTECVLGHLYGEFHEAVDLLSGGADACWAFEHGFDIEGLDEDARITERDYADLLAEAWTNEIMRGPD